MTLLTDTECSRVADAIAAVERDTDAELVTVLAPQADDYTYIPLLWAGLIALLIPGAVVFFTGLLSAASLVLAQWACFIAFALIFQLPALTTRLIPRPIRHWRAANLARRQFLEQNLHRTADATGMLIFVSEAERYVEILVDHGIAERLGNDTWVTIVERFTQQVKRGDTLDGFVRCIETCGEHLRTALPATHERNELPNRLVVLD